jgi:hypothetical protein
MDVKIVTYKCDTCGEERHRFDWITPCYGDKCCDCCKKDGLQSENCKLACLESELLKKGKKLNKNEEKGIFLERAMSNALMNLGIPHKHNPFKLYYSNYQGKNPDIIIEALNAIIECKNLNKKQIDLLSTQWLDGNVINRPNTANYGLKMVLFSYKPRDTLVKYLVGSGWRVYGLDYQILTVKQERKAIRRLKQQFWWLREKMKAREKLV